MLAIATDVLAGAKVVTDVLVVATDVLAVATSSIGGTRHIHFFCWLASGEAR